MQVADHDEPSPEFAACWRAAGRHLQGQAAGQISWLKSALKPPFLEHLSFAIGNQLFFVRIEDAAGVLKVPSSRSGLFRIAEGCKGNACLMPMRRVGGDWSAAAPGWGLLEATTGRSLDPVTCVSDERIEMTDWELQEFAVQVVRTNLEEQGRTLMSWQGDPAVNPSIWFVGDTGPEWVIVRAVRYPLKAASPPDNMVAIAAACAHVGRTGHFASVAVANADDPFDPDAQPGQGLPLWRGHGMMVAYAGLTPATGRAQ
jgi:hypothetical protein